MVTVEFLVQVIAAAFAAVGIEEFLKNFISFSTSKWWALVMVPLAVGCFYAAEMLPPVVLGSLLTIGSVQICYETLIQGFRAVIERLSGKMSDGRR